MKITEPNHVETLFENESVICDCVIRNVRMSIRLPVNVLRSKYIIVFEFCV
jgi:hypothetical protein